ncbi:LexA family protein [Streptomyces beijiangensis]|uniref:LexA family protein n=1 Tax=Streptomyces beijiangensis TaxID=163361 RepID=UPI0031D34A41
MLTDQQIRIARSAREYVAEHGEAPSMRELAAAVGLSSVATIAYHLQRMRERGEPVATRGRRISRRCPSCGR